MKRELKVGDILVWDVSPFAYIDDTTTLEVLSATSTHVYLKNLDTGRRFNKLKSEVHKETTLIFNKFVRR